MAARRPQNIYVLDACVLVPGLLRDLLLQVARQGIFQPAWSEEILREMIDAIVKVRIKRSPSPPPDRIRAAMMKLCLELNEAWPHAMVPDWHSLTPRFALLPDRNDKHVVATAHAGGAKRIITINEGDFPRQALPAGIRAQHPDQFLLGALAEHPEQIVEALIATAANSNIQGGMPYSPQDVVDLLIKTVPQASQALDGHLKPSIQANAS